MFVTVYITIADYWKIKKDNILKLYSNVEQYERYFKRYIMPEIGMLKIADVSSSDINRIVNNLFSAGKTKTIVSGVCALLRKIFHQAAVDKLSNEEIFQDLKPITWDRSEKRIFTTEQEKNLLLAFQSTTQPELYTLSMFTGIGYKELSDCSVNDYSRDEKTLRVVRKACQYYAKARNAKPLIRVIPLSDISCRVIDVAIKKHNEKNKNFPENQSDLIFTNNNNNAIVRIHKGEYRTIRDKSGIYDFIMRDLTSNFGVHALKYKINPTALKYYLGYKADEGINLMAVSCHNNAKDIQASDDYYRELRDKNE